ncbi:MAG: hypothetical protein ACJ8H8_23760 [Geminicoccaceae bacterium]
MAEREGANEGLVSVGSASRWDAPITLDAHHLELIGHPFHYGMSRTQRAAAKPPRDVPAAILDLLPWQARKP